MQEIFGISLKGIAPYHIEFLYQTFSDKKKTVSRVKELQSAIIFFTNNSESQDIGRQWRNKYAKDVNISVLIKQFKIIGAQIGVPLHRICKTAYPLFVYISNNYRLLQPYLETFVYVETNKIKYSPTPMTFQIAEEFVSINGYIPDKVKFAAAGLAEHFKMQNSTRVGYVTCVRLPHTNQPYFVVFKKENNKIISIDHGNKLDYFPQQTKTQKIENDFLILLSIDNLLNHPIVSFAN
jgi:hypothetical protein